MTPQSRRSSCWAAAALICLLAGTARADVDGGAPSDPGTSVDAGAIDGAVFEKSALVGGVVVDFLDAKAN